MTTTPKTPEPASADLPSNAEKDPDDWVTGDEPMTGAQASYLKTLCEEAGEDVRSRPDQGRGVEADRRPATAHRTRPAGAHGAAEPAARRGGLTGCGGGATIAPSCALPARGPWHCCCPCCIATRRCRRIRSRFRVIDRHRADRGLRDHDASISGWFRSGISGSTPRTAAWRRSWSRSPRAGQRVPLRAVRACGDAGRRGGAGRRTGVEPPGRSCMSTAACSRR